MLTTSKTGWAIVHPIGISTQELFRSVLFSPIRLRTPSLVTFFWQFIFILLQHYIDINESQRNGIIAIRWIDSAQDSDY